MTGALIRNDELLEQLGMRIHTLRKKSGHTQVQLASKAGIPTSQIARIEQGKVNPTICTLQTITLALDISLADLLAEESKIELAKSL